ncbi:hypothetical protein [Seonamhaeicola marinus]|uniref:Uncharacterized protein n=1 Tax=Seonamhaeicola marinus TaxID=1912246 RepID=A0A5D0HSF6_9FLAO|nr:hypothetical protein [Seonamhaeicola marinus]TYA74266.1 hypothetical protein FUA24_13110 [Seonamhaeicola marinus]
MYPNIELIIQRANSFLKSLKPFSDSDDKEYVVDPKTIIEHKYCYAFDWCDKNLLWMSQKQRPGRLGVGYLLADKNGILFDLIGHCWSMQEFEVLIHGHELSSININCNNEITFNEILEVVNSIYLNNITKTELSSRWKQNKIVFDKTDILNYFSTTPFNLIEEIQENEFLNVGLIYREISSPNYPLFAVDNNRSVYILKSDAENYKLLDVVIPQKVSGHVVGWNKDGLYHNKSYLNDGELVSHWLLRRKGEDLDHIKSLLRSKSPYASKEKNESYRTSITSFESINEIVDFLTQNDLEFLK